MNRKTSTVLIGSALVGIVLLLAIYMGLIVTGVIDTRPDDLVIVAKSAEKEYDGEPLVCQEYTIKSGTLKKGHTIRATYDATLTNVGSCANTIDVMIVDSLGADVTNHYNIETRAGNLTVAPRKLVIKSWDSEKVYDGDPLRSEGWDITVGKLPDNCRISAGFTGSQTAPGSSKNSFTVSISDQNGNSVDRNFTISYIYGTLTVTKRAITITSFGSSKIYDGQPLSYESYTLDGELAPDHSLSVYFPASITGVGSVTNNMNISIWSSQGDVTAYYDIVARVGTLTVEPRPIEISATPCIKYYTGDELPQGQWFITKGTLVPGHTLNADVVPIKNQEGTVEFFIQNVTISDGWTGKSTQARYADVSNNYKITLVHGIDRDEFEKLVIVSGSKSAPYTGQPLTCEQYVLSSGTLAPGHVIEPYFTGQQTEVGFSDNTFSVAVIDEATGEDVTYRYDLEYEFGTLEVYENTPGTGGEIGDDGSLDNNVQNADATAARIWADAGGKVYLRWKSYGNYGYRESTDSWGWADAVSWPLATSNMLHSVGKVLAADGKTPVLYQIEIYGNQYLLPNYTAQGAEGANNDVVLAPVDTGYSAVGYNWSYSYADAIRYISLGIEQEQMREYTEYVYAQYLDVPDTTRQALAAIAEANGLKADRLSIIEDVASFIRSAAVYDTEYHACPAGQDEVVYFLTESQSGVCRHFASAATLMYRTLGIPARYVVGYSTYATAQTWTDVKGADAHAWVEVFIAGLGWVRIDPTPAAGGQTPDDALVLSLTKVMGYYTGLPYYATEDCVVISQGSLKEGHVLASVSVSGSRTEVGQGTSTITDVRIEDQNGNDVTAQYNIVLRDGIIEVRAPSLTVTASSLKKQYDGTALYSETFTYSFRNTELGALYTVTAVISGSQTEVGQSTNTVGEVRVVDILGNDVTSNFDIVRNHGTLKVYLYEMSISAPGATKTYDGTPLSAPELSYDAAALSARGHRLEYSMPEITNVGSVYNTPTCTVLDANGQDVSAQYDISIHAGVLRVRPLKLTIQTDSASKVYDGTPLRVEGYTLTSGTFAPGQSISAYLITGSQTNVGVSETEVTAIFITNRDGRDVTANYQITILPGTLTVLAP